MLCNSGWSDDLHTNVGRDNSFISIYAARTLGNGIRALPHRHKSYSGRIR